MAPPQRGARERRAGAVGSGRAGRRTRSRPSSRASGAPRQKWIPCPNPRCERGGRLTSSASGSSWAAGSRLAPPMQTSTCWWAGIVTPSSSTGSVVTRNVACGTGGENRTSSSTAPGSIAGWSRSSWIWSGWSSRATTPLPMRLVVVSCPATMSWNRLDSSSCWVRRPSPSPAFTRTPTRSSAGAARWASTSSSR